MFCGRTASGSNLVERVAANSDGGGGGPNNNVSVVRNDKVTSEGTKSGADDDGDKRLLRMLFFTFLTSTNTNARLCSFY